MKRLGYVIIMAFFCMGLHAEEVTILLGPKTIGAGWKDNILLESRHFTNAKAGDVVTVYHDKTRGRAQAAFQDPRAPGGR